jgi:hypothetical protein
MANPKTKEELLAATARERDALQQYLATLTREQMLWCGPYGWSAVDHLAHLAEWDRMLFGWYEAGARGANPAVPAEGYSWATESDLNQRIFEQHHDEQPRRAMATWIDTSRRLIALAQSIPEADLFAHGRYAWTGRGTLASFVWECGGNHYRWAAREIKKGLKAGRLRSGPAGRQSSAGV